ncbi:asparaginase, partial [Streptomyces sp. S5]|uniref:asparaginase n=1 Tax=Streptomyces sp. S5 TaxID=1456735 RepID=UPI001969E0B2
RDEVAAAWGVAELPPRYGRDTGQIVEAAASGELTALLVGGVEVADLPDPARARQALDRAEFVVSLEQRPSEVTERADVVLPVAAVAEKSGTFLNWEGRSRMFEAALKPEQMTRRPDTWLMRALPGALSKMGAEAVQAVALPDGRALAFKVDDGATRALGPVLARLLERLGYAGETATRIGSAPLMGGAVRVGEIRAAF